MERPPDAVPVDDVVRELRAAGSVFAEEEAALLLDEALDDRDLRRMLDRRISGVPLEHVLGWAEFHGQRIRVTDGVFVPRRRTALLVETALGLAPRRALDLCCGSGAVGRALEVALPGCEVWAADLSPVAVACARTNLSRPDRVVAGDLYAALPEALRGTFDVVVANAPYVPTEELDFLPQDARLHEPASALDGGSDGLDLQRRVASGAREWLRPGGSLLVETSVRQAEASRQAMEAAGLRAGILRSEELDATVAVGVYPLSP